MKRWLVRIALCLILGAVTTVAVAWGCLFGAFLQVNPPRGGNQIFTDDGFEPQEHLAMWEDHFEPTLFLQSYEEIRKYEDALLFDLADETQPIAAIDSVTDSDTGAEAFYLRNRMYSTTFASKLVVLRCGLPLISMSGAIVVRDQDSVHGLFTLPDSFGGWMVPYFPIWPGFVIDTLFYAAIWFTLFFGFASAKRAIRRKRGRCPQCGYDLRGQKSEVSDQRSEVSGSHPNSLPQSRAGSIGCPECGWNREVAQAAGRAESGGA